MAYSFARSGRESYAVDKERSPNRQMEDNKSESGPEYLDFGFAWLNDYDKADNYPSRDNRADDLTAAQQEEENPYGWKALGATRHVSAGVSNPRQNRGDDLRQTGFGDLRESKKVGPRQSLEGDLRQSRTNNLKESRTQDLRRTGNYDFRDTNRDDIRQSRKRDNLRNTGVYEFRQTDTSYQTNRDALRNTAGNDLRDTVQFNNLAETQLENPYGWRALGATRHVPSNTSESEGNQHDINPRETGTDFDSSGRSHSYGMSPLGQTYHPAELSRKRTHKTSFTRENARMSNHQDHLAGTSNQMRPILHAKRLSVLPEEGVQSRIRDSRVINGALRGTTGREALRDTTDGAGLRGTAYDYTYTRNINRGTDDGFKSQKQANLQSNVQSKARDNRLTIEQIDTVSKRIPEHRRREWAKERAMMPTSQNWINMAGDQSWMTTFYQMFAQIKRKWAANYKDPSLLSGISGRSEEMHGRPSDFRYRSRQEDRRRRVHDRRKILLLCSVVFIVLLVAVVVPVAILTGGSSSSEGLEEKLWQYNLQATINGTFTDEMSDNSSEAFRNISQPFCKQIDMGIGNFSFNEPNQYIGCSVTSLSDGSIVINFIIVMSGNDAPDNITVLEVLGLLNQALLGYFELLENITVLARETVVDNPIPEKKSFNETCSRSSSCITQLSECINKTCICPENKFFENSTDTCYLISCEGKPNVTNGISKISGILFGDLLTIECNIGFEPSGNSNISCTSTDSWASLPTCIVIQCEDFIKPDHVLIHNETLVNMTYQDEIIVSCEDGFVLNGENKTTCQANKSWSNIPSCVPANCTDLDLPVNVIKATENISYAFQSVIELNCTNGYNLIGESKVSCQANRTWTEFPTCTPVTCSVFQFPENAAEQNGSNKEFNDEISIQCLTGYETDGDNTVKCLANGTWSESPNCTIIDCGDIDEPSNGTIEYREGTLFNDTLIVRCDDGFKLKEGSEENVTCTRYGQWSGVTECELKRCKEPNETLNSIFPNTIDTTILSVLTIECKTGFDLKGNSTVTCLEYETWSAFPTCEPVNCGEPPQVTNALNTMVNKTTFNATFEVDCMDGFELNGIDKATCQANKTWGNIPACVPVNCTDPDLPKNVVKTNENDSYSFQSVIELNCTSGYILTGENTVSCQANRTWTELPTCTPVKCSTFQFPENAAEENGSNKVFNDEVSIQCLTGYKTDGDNTVKCLANGIWSESPNCTIIDCGNPAEPINGTFENGEGTLFNDTLIVSCNDGFKLKEGSEENVTCTRYGNWSSVPECELKRCKEPNEIKYSIISNTIDTSILSVLMLECNTGYDLKGNSTVTCFENETWSAFPTCEPVDCGEPHSVNNSLNVMVNETTFNASFEVDCIDGFVLDGVNKASIVCQSNGTWTEIPECKPVTCPLFVVPNNSKIVNFNETSEFKYSDIVILDCETGFDITGNNSITCMEDGNWTSIPECVKIQCSSYKLENGRTGNQSFYSEILDIECNIGYDISNNNSVNCTENGKWSVNVTCEPIECNSFSSPEHAFIVNAVNKTSFNTKLQVSCDDGYALIDDNGSFVTCEADGNWTGNPECEEVPDVNFLEPEATVQIGDSKILQCVLSGNLSNLDAVVSRNSSVQGEQHLCYVNQTGPGNCSISRVTGNGLRNGNNMTVTVTLDKVECEDEGTYFCESASSNPQQAVMQLSVTRPITGRPLLTKLPLRMVANLSETYQNISCSADVGYPAGDLRVEYSKDNFTSWDNFSIGNISKVENANNCSVNTTIYISSYTFTEDFNNTDIRCAVYNSSVNIVPTAISDVSRIELVKDECPSNGIAYQYHPFNCHHYIFCNDGHIFVSECGGNQCPDIQDNQTPPACSSNCTFVNC